MAHICFHVGFGKTATTYLQKKVFTKFRALGRGSCVPGAEAVERRFASMVCRSEPDIWMKKEGYELADSIHSIAKDELIFYSTEYLASPPFLAPDNVLQTQCPDRLLFVEHIKNFAEYSWKNRGDVTVLLTVRNQADWLGSYYAQRSSRFKASQSHFERFVLELLETNDFSGAGFLEYDRLIASVESHLGPGKCSVLVYEEMNCPQFWRELASIVGHDLLYDARSLKNKENISRVSANCWSLKARNTFSGLLGPERMLKQPLLLSRPGIRLCKQALTHMDRLVSKQKKQQICLNSYLHDRIMSRFRNSNKQLELILGRNLCGWDVTK